MVGIFRFVVQLTATKADCQMLGLLIHFPLYYEKNVLHISRSFNLGGRCHLWHGKGKEHLSFLCQGQVLKMLWYYGIRFDGIMIPGIYTPPLRKTDRRVKVKFCQAVSQ